MQQAELEDIFLADIYREKVEQAYHIVLEVPAFHSNKKWSDRMRDTFLGHGKLWNDRIRGEIKTLVAETVVGTPTTALSEHKRGSFDGLVTTLQQRLAALHT